MHDPKMTAEYQAMAASWQVTFADLLTLLVTIFVLFISMSSFPDKVEGKGLAKAQDNWVDSNNGTPVPEPPGLHIGKEGARMAQLKTAIARSGATSDLILSRSDRGLTLRFANGPLFEEGRLATGASERLGRVANFLGTSDMVFEVTANAEGQSGWKTAAEHAEAVVNALEAAGANAAQLVPVVHGVAPADGTPSVPRDDIEFVLKP